MRIKFFCPYWGSENMSVDYFYEKVKNEGYNGVEMGLPADKTKKNEFLKGLAKFDLELIGQHYETLEPDFQKHKKLFTHYLENLTDSPALFINSQTGKDYYSFEQNKELIDIAGALSLRSGTKILHETHRGKFSFAAHITARYLDKLPDLRITLDISHWYNVAESFLDDQTEAVEKALRRTDHIHSRVGYQEGPQIPDPRDPAWQNAVQSHIDWWDKVIEIKRDLGAEQFTITSEFGAPPYLVLLPYSQNPISSQWKSNVYMMQLLKGRYENLQESK